MQNAYDVDHRATSPEIYDVGTNDMTKDIGSKAWPSQFPIGGDRLDAVDKFVVVSIRLFG